MGFSTRIILPDGSTVIVEPNEGVLKAVGIHVGFVFLRFFRKQFSGK